MPQEPSELPLVRTSERKCFRRCPQQWWWSYRQGLRNRGESPDALWLGTGVHLALAQWYQSGYKRSSIHPSDFFAEWAEDEVRYVKTYQDDSFDEPVWEDATELGYEMLQNYIDHYGMDADWYVLAIEKPFRVMVHHRGEPIAVFLGTWDGVFRDKADGRIYLMEHKTAAQISTAYLELDDQAGGYWAVATSVLRSQQVLKPNEEIAGITYNFLRKAKLDERPQNEAGQYLNRNGSVSKKQPPPYFIREVIERQPSELKSQMLRLADEVSVMNGMRNGSIPVYKNTARECTWCEFFHMCTLHERGGDDWKVLAAEYTVENPYSAYVKSAAE